MKIKKKKKLKIKRSKESEAVPVQPFDGKDALLAELEKRTVKGENCGTAFDATGVFLAETRDTSTSQFVRNVYRRLFEDQLPPEGVIFEQVRVAVAYELLFRDFKRVSVKLSSKILRRREAALAFKIEGLGDITKLKIKNEKESIMSPKSTKLKSPKKAPAAKKVASRNKGKTTGLSVTQYYERLFAENAKTKSTDAALAKQMQKEFPLAKDYSETDIRIVRGLYDRGQLSSQDKSPAKPSFIHAKDAGNYKPKAKAKAKAKAKPKAKGKKKLKLKKGKKKKAKASEEEIEVE